MKNIFKLCVLFFTAILVAGCASGVTHEAHSPYTTGVLKGEGVKIEALDKSFVISEGRFSPPFQTNMRPVEWTSIYSTFHLTDGWGNKTFSGVGYLNPTKHEASLIDSYNLALKNGAKRVLVHHPASNEPLYGVLLLNKKSARATGPAARSYLINIGEKYINEAKNGGTSVTFEPVPVNDKYDSNVKLYGWVLWLSNVPFN